MTNPEQIRQQKARRLQQLSQLARKRYLDAGGNPLRYANEQQLNDEEQQEFQTLLSQVFDQEYINQYLDKHQKLKSRQNLPTMKKEQRDYEEHTKF